MVVVETVYRPERTAFLMEAAKRGCRVVEGKEMFVRQGAAQLRLWTGLEPPLEVMRRVVDAHAGTSEGSDA
jgi:shikimate 5-dehydrogenase